MSDQLGMDLEYSQCAQMLESIEGIEVRHSRLLEVTGRSICC